MIEELRASDDLGEVTSLLNEHRLAGQPIVTDSMVCATLTCDAVIDAWYYEQLTDSHVVVGRDEAGAVTGSAAYGDTRDGVRDLLWLIASDPGVATELVDDVFAGWGGPARAFWYAPTVSAGLEGLPRQHQSDVHDVLIGRGFLGRDLWSYQLLQLPNVGVACEIGFKSHGVVKNSVGVVVAEYDIGIPYEGLGAIWWLETIDEHRGQGYGRTALNEALAALADHGATRAVLYVDDDDTSGERDRRAAKALYASVGFREVDRLWSYSKGGLPPER